MNKKIFLALALAATGCWGSDPNVNSMVGDAAKAGTSGGDRLGRAARATRRGRSSACRLATFATATEGFQLNVVSRHRRRRTSATRRRAPRRRSRFDSSAAARSRLAQGGGALLGRQPVRRHPEEHDDVAARTGCGKTMHVRIKVREGKYPGGAQVYAITVPDAVQVRRHVHEPREEQQLARVHRQHRQPDDGERGATIRRR